MEQIHLRGVPCPPPDFEGNPVFQFFLIQFFYAPSDKLGCDGAVLPLKLPIKYIQLRHFIKAF
jgi:hypothetical protein